MVDPRPAPTPRDALFDLAVARAAAYLRARPPAASTAAAIRQALEPWALRTRFATRVELDALARALALRPAAAARWRGGVAGRWELAAAAEDPG